MKKIESLTAEQEKRLIEVREYWLKVGLSTERADRITTENTITQMYGLIGKERPRFIWMDSPFGAMISINLAKKCMEKKMGANLRENLGANLGDNLWANLGANLGDNLRENLGANLRENLRANLRENLRANLGDNLRANLRENLRENLRANLGANLGDNLWANLGANLGDNLGDNLRANLFESTYFWGSIEAYWVGYYKFANEIGVPYEETDKQKLNLWSDLAHSCFWWWPYEGACFISDRPKAIHRKNGLLHNESGLAIEFHDGYGMFALNGVRVPAKVVTTPAENLDAKEIINEKNVEVRRELIRKIGIERFIQKAGAKVLDKQGDYELLSVALSDEVPDARYLKMLNPSIGVYHIEGVEGNTVDEAINFRAGAVIQKGEKWAPAVLT